MRKQATALKNDDKDGNWSIKITDGEKHSFRIKKLNAVKRNEAFDEKYEETREEREERQVLADKKRLMIQQLQNGAAGVKFDDVKLQTE